MGFEGFLMNKLMKKCIHNCKEMVTFEELPIKKIFYNYSYFIIIIINIKYYSSQAVLCALVIFEGKKIYLIPSNSLVAACFYANLVWNIWFGVDVFLRGLGCGFISCRTRTTFVCWVETKLCFQSALACCTCCC